jgi:hypothetical protein
MDIKLTFYDRISIPTIFPEKANFADGIIYDDIRQKIKITQEEVVTHEIKNTPDGTAIEWKNEPVGGKDFDFTDAEKNLVLKALKALDDRAEVPTDPKFILLYKKFIN